MRMIELCQRSENGGFPTSNEDQLFGHGEYVLVVSKRELLAFLEDIQSAPTIHASQVMAGNLRAQILKGR